MRVSLSFVGNLLYNGCCKEDVSGPRNWKGYVLYMLRLVTLFFVVFLLPGVETLGGQAVREENGRVIERSNCPPVWPRKLALTMRYKLAVTGNTSKATVTCLIPQSLDRRQKVRRIIYSVKPEKVFSANGSRYAQFVFTKPKGRISIEVKVLVDTYRYDLTMAECESEPAKSARDYELEKYLRSERFIDSDHEKIAIAAGLLDGGDELARIRSVFEYVLEHVKYIGYVKRSQGAIKTFESGQGDCTDYTDLLVALCRANEIPARHVQGFLAFSIGTPKHSWAEVYTSRLGWIPFDALQADLERPGYDFDMLKNRHIYLSYIRNDRTLGRRHTFWYYRYWGDPISVTDSYEITKLDRTGKDPW